MRTDSPAEDLSHQLPSQSVRTVATLVLFVHLFAVAAAMISNPQDMMRSQLLSKLGGVPFLAAYTRLLWMAGAYDFYYTYYHVAPDSPDFLAVRGAEHEFEVELTYADGRSETVRIPEVGKKPHLRFERERNLVDGATFTIGQQGAESFVPAGIAQHMLLNTNAQTVNVRLVRWTPLTMPLVRSTDPRERDPHDARYRKVVYTGIAQMRNGKPSFQKLETVEQSAPTTSAPAPSTAAPPPSTAAPPPRRPAQGPAPR
jgi:hypothetical protein